MDFKSKTFVYCEDLIKTEFESNPETSAIKVFGFEYYKIEVPFSSFKTETVVDYSIKKQTANEGFTVAHAKEFVNHLLNKKSIRAIKDIQSMQRAGEIYISLRHLAMNDGTFYHKIHIKYKDPIIYTTFKGLAYDNCNVFIIGIIISVVFFLYLLYTDDLFK